MIQLKSLLSFILLSKGIALFACGYYPYGDDIRICMFSPSQAEEPDAEPFFYSNSFFNEFETKELSGPIENLEAWRAYFEDKYTLSEIDAVIYGKAAVSPRPYGENTLANDLKDGAWSEFQSYLSFAWRVEDALSQDFWSGKEMDVNLARKLLESVEKKVEGAEETGIRGRYYYQGVVLAYYTLEDEQLKRHYENMQQYKNELGAIYYWGMFFYAERMTDEVAKALLLSEVFEHSRAKNEYIHIYHFRGGERPIDLLSQCETDEQKAAVLGIHAFHTPGRSLDDLKAITALNPQSKIIDLLLVREINKVEDWLFTDRYTSIPEQEAFFPTSSYYYEVDLKKEKADQKYLKSLISFCRREIEKGAVENKALWASSLAYLYYMSGNRTETTRWIMKASHMNPSQEVQAQLDVTKLLAKVSFDEVWNNEFQEELYTMILEIQKHSDELYNYERFEGQVMLAISRKYLLHGDVIHAALFEGKVTGGTYEHFKEWGTPSYQVFNLLNSHADASTMERFFTLWNKSKKTDLETYLFEGLEPFRWRLTDLWGTAYFREDRLNEALAIYEMVPDSVWEVENAELHYFYHDELDANPFETRFSRSSVSDDYSVSYTKPEFIRKIIDLKEKARTEEKNRAYHYMLLGNAYYNSTIAGNSWYYSDYWLSSNTPRDQGTADYFTGERALHYYRLAEESSQNEAFSAFCYRLQWKCLRMQGDFDNIYPRYEKKFIKKYPEHARRLEGCDYFTYYFSQWKKA